MNSCMRNKAPRQQLQRCRRDNCCYSSSAVLRNAALCSVIIAFCEWQSQGRVRCISRMTRSSCSTPSCWRLSLPHLREIYCNIECSKVVERDRRKEYGDLATAYSILQLHSTYEGMLHFDDKKSDFQLRVEYLRLVQRIADAKDKTHQSSSWRDYF